MRGSASELKFVSKVSGDLMKKICLIVFLFFLSGCESPRAFSSVSIYSLDFNKEWGQGLSAKIYRGNPVRQVDDTFIKQEKGGLLETQALIYGDCEDICVVEWLVDSNVVERISFREQTDGRKDDVVSMLVVLSDDKKYLIPPPKGRNHWKINLDSLKRIQN